MKLGFIGAGNMAGAIIKGFVNKNCVNSSVFTLSDRIRKNRLNRLVNLV